MRIAIDLTALAFNFSGIERFALNISKRMIENNNEDIFCLLFCNEVYTAFQQICNKKNVEYKIVKAQKNKISKLFMFQFSNLIALKKFKADRYVFLAFAPPLLFRDKNIVTTIHDIGYFDCPKMWKWYVTLYGKCKICLAVRHSKKLVAVSEFTKNRIREKFGYKKNIDIVYNAIDSRFNTNQVSKQNEENIKNKYNLPHGSFLLCLSTLEPRKNLPLLIQAYSDLKVKQQIKAELVIAGRKGWKIEHLLDNIDPQIKRTIHITGFVDDDDLPEIYKLADCFVFPSIYEGFGIPPLEAISCGTQTIVSDLFVFKETLGDAAIYFKNNDLIDLKDKILHSKKIDESILAKQSTLYSWDSSAKKYMEIINYE